MEECHFTDHGNVCYFLHSITEYYDVIMGKQKMKTKASYLENTQIISEFHTREAWHFSFCLFLLFDSRVSIQHLLCQNEATFLKKKLCLDLIFRRTVQNKTYFFIKKTILNARLLSFEVTPASCYVCLSTGKKRWLVYAPGIISHDPFYFIQPARTPPPPKK